MSESGDKLDAAYRAIAREEPRAAIDDAILAASRRALVRRPAAHRWAAPVSIAAVLVLAFGVTLHMGEESPDIVSPERASAPPPAASSVAPVPAPKLSADAPAASAPAQIQAPQSKPDLKQTAPPPAKKIAPLREEFDRPLRDEQPQAREPERKDLAPQAAAPAQSRLAKEANVMQAPAPQATLRASAAPPPPAPAAPPMQAAESPQGAAVGALRAKREIAAAPAPGLRAADASLDEPTRELEAIAKLRAEGRGDEADKALAEFRRKRPDYRIPDAMWERVKPG